MNKEMIMADLQQIFRDLFDDEEISISESTSSNDIEDWDSLEHINLILLLEKHFNIKFEMDEVVEMSTVGNIVRLIMSKLQ